MYSTESVSMKEIEWASLLYTLVTGFDETYARTMTEIDKNFRPLNEKDKNLSTDESIGKIIINFLHRWHTQGVSNKSSIQLTNKVKALAEELEAANKSTMHKIPSEKVEFLYEGIRSVPGFGPTATAKTLHLLCGDVRTRPVKCLVRTFSSDF